MHGSSHSSFRAELSRADSKVSDANMPDRTSQLPWLQLHDLEVGATGSLAQIIRAVDWNDFQRQGFVIQCRIKFRRHVQREKDLRAVYWIQMRANRFQKRPSMTLG